MTAIAGLRTEDGELYVGADSAGVAGWGLVVRADRKVFKVTDEAGEPWLFGFTQSFRMGQLIRYALRIPAPPADVELEEYLATRFVDRLRQCFAAGGFREKENEVESGGTFIAATRGRLFVIESDFQVAEPADPFAAVGCGEDLVLGALYATEDFELEPRKRIQLALRAAERFSAGVRGPFHIESLRA